MVIGIIIGLGSADLWIGGTDVGGTIMQVVLTLKNLLGSLINFCVPLIIIGFIAPSITRLRSNASRMLVLALALAYTSSVCAALMSMGAGYAIIPGLSIQSAAEGLREAPELLFNLDIAPVMSVMSALVFSVLVGLAATWTRAKVITQVLEEFQRVVLAVVSRVVIPILPFFIAGTFCGLAYEGSITRQLPVFLIVILIVMVGHYLWLAVLYLLAGLYSGEKPWEVLRHYGPAYLTAVGTMSSAATLAVALEGARKSKVLRRDMVDFGIPLFANIHLCGSVLTEVFFVMTVSKVLYGELPSLPTMILFCFLLGVFAVGAPGVPGGTVMASLGLIISVVGFDNDGTGLMMTIFALQDSFGTACNITGDGALTLMLTGYAKKHNIQEAPGNPFGLTQKTARARGEFPRGALFCSGNGLEPQRPACLHRPGVVEKRIRRQEAKVTGVPLLDRLEQVAGAACPQEVAVSGVAQNGLHLSGDGHHLAHVDAGGDTGLVAHVDHILRGDVAGSTGDKGTAAKTAKGGVKTGHAGLHGGHDIGHGNAAGVVEVEPPRDSGEFGVDMGTHLIDLVGDAHARGIGQGDLGDAHVQICIDDGVDLGLRDAAVPGGAEGHGNGAGDLDPVLRGGLDTVGKTGYTLLRSHIQILQVVLTAGGDIQLHLFAAAVRGALDAPQIGDQSAELHAGEFIDQSLEQVIRICHLGHLFGVHEGADLDHGEAGVHQVPQKGELILGGDDGLFVLEAVAQAHLTDGDFRG